MDLRKILDNMKDPDFGHSAYGMNDVDAFKKNTDIRIGRDKFALDSSSLYLVPLQLVFPFNPFNPGDKNYNKKSKYVSPYSCGTTIFAIKAEMRKHPKLKEFFCKQVEIKPEEYVLNQLDEEGQDKITEGDWRIFDPYRKILHYHALVQKLDYSACGKYGTKILSNVKLNNAGIVVGEKDLGYKIYEFEQAITAQKVSNIYAEYAEGGEKFGHPTSERTKEVEAAWKECPMSKPYKLGSLRVVKLPSDSDYLLEKDIKKELVSKGSEYLGKCEKTTSGNKRETLRFEGYLGKQTDIFMDFLEIGIRIPDSDESEGKLLDAYSRRDFQTNVVTRINKQIPNIEEMYRKFRDDTDRFCEDVMLRSVREWKQWDDELLLQAVKEDLTDDKKLLISNETLKQYNKLLKKIDNQLTVSLMEKSMEGLLGDGDQTVSLDGLADPDEDIKGFGYAVVDDEKKDLDYDLDDTGILDVDGAENLDVSVE